MNPAEMPCDLQGIVHNRKFHLVAAFRFVLVGRDIPMIVHAAEEDLIAGLKTAGIGPAAIMPFSGAERHSAATPVERPGGL